MVSDRGDSSRYMYKEAIAVSTSDPMLSVKESSFKSNLFFIHMLWLNFLFSNQINLFYKVTNQGVSHTDSIKFNWWN